MSHFDTIFSGYRLARTIIFGMLASMETIVIFSSLLFSFKELSFVKINKRNVKRSPDGPLTNLPPRRDFGISFQRFCHRRFFEITTRDRDPRTKTDRTGIEVLRKPGPVKF